MTLYELPIESLEAEFMDRLHPRNYYLEFSEDRLVVSKSSLRLLLNNLPIAFINDGNGRYPVIGEFSFYGKGNGYNGVKQVTEFRTDTDVINATKGTLEKTCKTIESRPTWLGTLRKLSYYNVEPLYEKGAIYRVFSENDLVGFMYNETPSAKLIENVIGMKLSSFAKQFIDEMENSDFPITGHIHPTNTPLISIGLGGGDSFLRIIEANILNVPQWRLSPYFKDSEDYAEKVREMLRRKIDIIIGVKIENIKRDSSYSGIEHMVENWDDYFTLLPYRFLLRRDSQERVEHVTQIIKEVEII